MAAREPLLAAAGEVEVTDASKCVLADGAAGENNRSSNKVQKKLLIALLLCFAFMILEVVGGILANSLAIMTDAAHLLSDVSGFGVSLFAGWYATRKSHSAHTFGYHRVEVLGALASVLSIWLVTGILVYEAVNRVINPVRVEGKLMFFLALAGCGVNLINLFVLGHGHSHGGHSHSHSHSHGHSHGDGDGHGHDHGGSSHESGGDRHCRESNGHSHAGGSHSHGDEEAGLGHLPAPDCGGDAGSDHGDDNINMRGAILHIIGDLVQSIGVAAAGALIWWKQDDERFRLADPICTFVFALLVLFTTRLILQDISDILMERVPRHLDVDRVERELTQVEGVGGVSDLHIWSLKPGIPLLAAHVTLQGGADGHAVQAAVTSACRRLGISHTTVQVDEEGHGGGCQTLLPRSSRPLDAAAAI